ncbi:MAG TPA: TilS substrate-binding domain-containing protein, partial [Candidatus Omnitrophota bacterium]|nr:TilS substrate-binding domain-containing protein [Candidatus Omnitrophota bacterium]
KLHPALQSAAVRLAIEKKRGHLRRLTHVHIDSVLALAASAKPDLILSLPGLLVRKRSGKLHFVDTLRK